MATRQIIEVVKCRVADLKTGDIVKPDGHDYWQTVQRVMATEHGNLMLETDRSMCPLLPWDLVDLQLTRTAYNNAPHMVDAHLPEDGAPAAHTEFDVGDEGDRVRVAIFNSEIDGTVVVDIDTTFEPYGTGPGAPGDEGRDIRINLNDGKIWDCGLWNPKHEQRVPDSA